MPQIGQIRPVQTSMKNAVRYRAWHYPLALDASTTRRVPGERRRLFMASSSDDVSEKERFEVQPKAHARQHARAPGRSECTCGRRNSSLCRRWRTRSTCTVRRPTHPTLAPPSTRKRAPARLQTWRRIATLTTQPSLSTLTTFDTGRAKSTATTLSSRIACACSSCCNSQASARL